MDLLSAKGLPGRSGNQDQHDNNEQAAYKSSSMRHCHAGTHETAQHVAHGQKQGEMPEHMIFAGKQNQCRKI